MSEGILPSPTSPKKEITKRILRKEDYARIMVQQATGLHNNFIDNGRDDLEAVGKLDDKKQIHPVTMLPQDGCMFIDIVPSFEEDVPRPTQLVHKPHSMLFDQEGDSSFMERNVLARIAVRNLNGEFVYTIETWGKIDTEEAISLADLVEQGVPDALPSYLQIDTAGKNEETLTGKLHAALEFIVPNIFEENNDTTNTQIIPFIPPLSNTDLKRHVDSITEMYGKKKN